jgi:ADP-ribose pyrophosphatase YjhB (NUDIX family)
MNPGETVLEACQRELEEETGIRAHIGRLIAIYSSPDYVSEYRDGGRWQIVDLLFAAERIGGTLTTSDETAAANFFTAEETAPLRVLETHRQRIADAFNGASGTLVR